MKTKKCSGECGKVKPLEAQQREQYYIDGWPTKIFNVIYYSKIELSDKAIERFWKKVNIKGKNECWGWLGKIQKTGYGRIQINYSGNAAHRISYRIAHPDVDLVGCIVRHKCDNKLCVNPNHLEIGSCQDNMRDKPEVKKYKAFGEEKYLIDWIQDNRCHNTVTYPAIVKRIYRKWDIERAITTPLQKNQYG